VNTPTPSSSSFKPEDIQQNKIRAEQVRLLYQGLPESIFSALAVASILVYALWGVTSHTILMLWASVLLILSVSRLRLASMYKKTQPEDAGTQAWLVKFIIGSTLAGLVWGSAGVWLMPSDSIGYQLLVCFVIGGVMAGSTQTLSAILPAYVMFCIPAGLPAVIWLFMQNTPIASAMSLLLSLYTLSLVFIARNLNKVVTESFRLRFTNVDLLADMKQEIGARKESEDLMRRSNDILEMLATSFPLSTVLHAINIAIEKEIPLAISSILLLDEAGKHLHSASSPNLPDEYVGAINGVTIGPSVGSCGTAVYRNDTVIVEDIARDPLWADFKALAISHGLRACWSMPFRDSASEVLGTFALYFKTSRKPEKKELDLLHWAGHLTGIAIERHSTAEKLQQMAYFDMLTKLPNRAMFMDRFEQALAQARRGHHKLALLFIDLDRFKLVNDTLGHEAGDFALREVANRLRACVREVDTAARIGGDEFTLVLTEIHKNSDAELVAGKVIDVLSQDIAMDGHNMSVGGSIGISLFPDDGDDIDTLIAKSDAAMYQAKNKGGNTMVSYSDELSEKA